MSKLCILMIVIAVGVLKRPQPQEWSMPLRPPNVSTYPRGEYPGAPCYWLGERWLYPEAQFSALAYMQMQGRQAC
jgi:hypothetical protein